MEKKFFCKICKDVGGTNNERFKCATHSFICRDCVESKGFFTAKFICKKCGKQTIGYDWDSSKSKWIQA